MARWTYGTGAAGVIVVMVGNGLASAGQKGGNHPSPVEALAGFRDFTSQNMTGVVLEVVGLVLLTAFMLQVAVRAAAARVPAALAASAALSFGVIKIASAAPFLAGILDADRLTPELAQVLNDMNGVSFVLSWLPVALFAASAGLALRGVLARGWWLTGLVLGALGVVPALAGVADPVNAVPVAFLLTLLWLIGLSGRLAVRD